MAGPSWFNPSSTGSVPWFNPASSSGIPWLGGQPARLKRPSEQKIRETMRRFSVDRETAITMLTDPDLLAIKSDADVTRYGQKMKYKQDLIRRGMDPQMAQAAATTWEQKQLQGVGQEKDALDYIFQGLRIPQNFFANVMHGAREYNKNHPQPGGVFGAFESIFTNVLPSMGVGIKEGFSESPLSKYGMDDFLAQYEAETNDPLLKNRVVSLGVQLVTDPVMYLSFGAGAPAKLGALKALDYATRMSTADAIKLIAKKGPILDEGGRVMTIPEVADMISRQMGRPITIGDALIDMRRIGMEAKTRTLAHPIQTYQERLAYLRSPVGKATSAALVPAPLRAGIGTTGRVLGAALLPTSVKGGRGVRFAGMEIPGTPRLGEMLGQKTRGIMRESETISTVGRALIPRWQIKMLDDDQMRALATGQIARMRDRVGALEKSMKEEAVNVARHDAQLVGIDERMGVMKKDPSKLTPAQFNLRQSMTLAKGRVMQRAEKLGVRSKEIEDLWLTALSKNADPVQALGEFRYRSEARLMAEEFTQEVLDNPNFAMKWNDKFQKQGSHFGDLEKSPYEFYGDVTQIPEGYIGFTHGNKKYIVRNVIYSALDEFRNPKVIDGEIRKFLALMGKPQQWWRVYATTPNPSFHIMNFLGAVWNNLLNGVWNPMDYVDSAATLYRARLAEFAKQGRVNIIGVPKLTPAREAAAQVVHEAEIRGGLGRGTSIFNELVIGRPLERLPGEIPTRRQSAKALLLRAPGETKKGFVARQARRSVGGFGIATANPVLAAMAFAPEAARFGRRVGSAVEDIVRLAPFEKHAMSPEIVQAIEAYGPIRVAGLKNYKGITKAQTKELYDYGAAVSRHYQFDYQDLTHLEREWAKTFFPFWTFYKNNVALQFAEVARHPRYLAGVQALENYISEYGNPIGPESEFLPGYFRELNAFAIPVPKWMRQSLGLSLTEPMYVNPKLPFVSINLFPPFWQMMQNNGMTNAQKFAVSLSNVWGSIGPWAPLPVPGAKIMIEAWINKQLGLNQSIDYQRSTSGDLRQSFVDAPGWVKYLPDPMKQFLGIVPIPWNPLSSENLVEVQPGRYKMTATSRYILEQMATPFITNLGRSALSVEPGIAGEKGTADMVSWLTGLRLIPVDTVKIHREWAMKMADMLNAEKARLKKEGKFLSSQDQESLNYLNLLIKQFQTYIDRRDAEMYGNAGK